jgi:membrane fusion protein (multidrug efflux system)
VRIEITNYDPDKAPLFVGLSVTPTVDLNSTPTGPNAGQFLQDQVALPASQTAPSP